MKSDLDGVWSLGAYLPEMDIQFLDAQGNPTAVEGTESIAITSPGLVVACNDLVNPKFNVSIMSILRIRMLSVNGLLHMAKRSILLIA